MTIKKAFELSEKRRKAEEAMKDVLHLREQELLRLQKIRKDAEVSKTDLVRFLKQSFKHIEGMQHARKQGAGLSELERYDTQEVELLIERKLLRPSNNVLEC